MVRPTRVRRDWEKRGADLVAAELAKSGDVRAETALAILQKLRTSNGFSGIQA